ncbi:MAG: hydrogenase maturation nickel metallochaperone HypA [Zoogloea sp.]|nr:hydrogenase maturation nickel metallochaperone HypA [Zoogloea sp.]
MHEMSLAEGIRGIVENAAASQEFGRVKTVVVEIGQLSTVEVDALRFCFEAVMHGSIAEGAALEVIDIPGSAWCMQCSETVAISQRYDPCPRCGSYQVQPTGGTEMRVRELEVE